MHRFLGSGLFGAFLIEVIGGGHFLAIHHDGDFETVPLFELIPCKELVGNGLAVFLDRKSVV